jgi:hypothetical protein
MTTEELLEAVFSVIRAAAVAYVSAGTNPDATMEEFFKVVFSARSVPRGYKRDEV